MLEQAKELEVRLRLARLLGEVREEAELQGRVASVNMVGVFGGMIVGQALGGVIAQVWGLTAPWWFAFGGAALTLLLVWRPISQIVSAKPVAQTGPDDVDAQSVKEP